MRYGAVETPHVSTDDARPPFRDRPRALAFGVCGILLASIVGAALVRGWSEPSWSDESELARISPMTAATSTATASEGGGVGDIELTFELLQKIDHIALGCAGVQFASCGGAACAVNDDNLTASCGCTKTTNYIGSFDVSNATAFLITSPVYQRVVASLAKGGANATTIAQHKLCGAIAANTLWPGSDLTSTHTQGTSYRNTTTCNTTRFASCMGAPCYSVPYDSQYEVTCVCSTMRKEAGESLVSVEDTDSVLTAGACAKTDECAAQYTVDTAYISASLETAIKYGDAMRNFMPVGPRSAECPVQENSYPLNMSGGEHIEPIFPESARKRR